MCEARWLWYIWFAPWLSQCCRGRTDACCALTGAVRPVAMQGLHVLPFSALLSGKALQIVTATESFLRGHVDVLRCMLGIQAAVLLEGGRGTPSENLGFYTGSGYYLD